MTTLIFSHAVLRVSMSDKRPADITSGGEAKRVRFEETEDEEIVYQEYEGEEEGRTDRGTKQQRKKQN
jgi:hypothetical protein